MKSLSHLLWLEREAKPSERGQARAKQNWGVAGLFKESCIVTGLASP
jgi:hypothetical protein